MSKKDQDPYELKRIYEEMELELIASLRRNLLKHKLDEYEAGFSWEMWQSALLRNIKEYRKENTSIIYKAKSYINNAIKNVLHFFYKKGKVTDTFSNDTSKIFPQEGVNTGKVGHEPPEETNFFAINKRKVEAMIKSTKSDFNDVDNAIYRKMDDVYRQIIYNVGVQMAHGTISLDKAIDIAMEKFLAKGIDSIVYKNGRQVNVASYAEMALRTASQRATFLGGGAKRDELCVHLVFVSAHANCCELCRPWQGQILIDDVFSHPSEEYMAKHRDKYELLSKAIKAGLLHPNCRHTIATYFEGITRIPTIPDDETIQKNYRAEQEQRQLENKIRKVKRYVAGTTDETNQKTARKELRQVQKELRDHLDKYPELKRQPHREKIYGTSQPKLRKLKEFYAMDDKDVRMKVINKEASIADKKYETAYLYDRKGNILLRKQGTEGEVEFSESELKLMKNAIATHNHPMGTTLSPDDIYMAIEHELQEIRATGSRGTYVLRRNENLHLMPDIEVFAKEYNLLLSDYSKAYKRKYGASYDRIHYQQLVQMNAMNDMAKKYGLLYWREVNEIE